MRWRSWWADQGITIRDKQFKNRRGCGISKGVLVAISIPIFTAQLEKAREATDAANLRSAYAEISAAVLTSETTPEPIKVDQKQTKAGWDTNPDFSFSVKAPVDGASADFWSVEWDATNEVVVAK